MEKIYLRKMVYNHVSPITLSLRKYVCPIYSLAAKEARPIAGSATLLKIGEHHFLLSAAHVLKKIFNQHLYIPKGNALELFSPLTDGQLHSTKSNSLDHNDDTFDVAYIRIRPGAVEKFSQFEFLSITDLEVDDHPLKLKPYYITGYPDSKTKFLNGHKKLDERFYAYVRFLADKQIYSKTGLSPFTHIILDLDRKKSVGANLRVETAPHPRGMSGGGVWCQSIDAMTNKVKGRPKLAGISVSYQKSPDVVIATKIPLILTMISKNIPNLTEIIPKSTIVTHILK